MAEPSLAPFYGHLEANQDYTLKARIFGMVSVGNGKFSVLSPSEISFSGSYNVAGNEGNVTVGLKVTGNNTGEVSWGGVTEPCTFHVDGNYLYVYFKEGGGQTSLKLEYWRKGLWIGGEALPSHVRALWIV